MEGIEPHAAAPVQEQEQEREREREQWVGLGVQLNGCVARWLR